MKQKFVTFMLALLATTALFAQNKVTGNVSDAQGPAIGVSVVEKGTNNGVITGKRIPNSWTRLSSWVTVP